MTAWMVRTPSFEAPRKREEVTHPTKLTTSYGGLSKAMRAPSTRNPVTSTTSIHRSAIRSSLWLSSRSGRVAVSPDQGHDDADDGGQPGKIEDKRENQVEIAVQVGDAEEGPEEVVFEGDEARPYGKKEETPEDEQVHHARIGFAAPQDRPVKDRALDIIAYPFPQPLAKRQKARASLIFHMR